MVTNKPLNKPIITSVILLLLTLYAIHFHQNISDRLNDASNDSEAETRLQKSPSVWISISVCWSSNTNFQGKRNFPYAYAAFLSTRLWVLKTKYKVIISVVIQDGDVYSEELLRYVTELRKMAEVVSIVSSGFMPCQMKSQLQILFGFLATEVKDEDYIVSSDVDAFVMDPNIFSNLKDNFSVWVYQYSEVLYNQETVPICFIAMKKTLWRQLMSTDTPEKLLDRFNSTLNISKDITQIIMSRILLESGLCTAPRDNTLWSKVNLTPPDTLIDDSHTCFHGMNWRNCYSGSDTFKFPGCKWWHFTSDASKEHILERYNIIVHQHRFR